MISISSAAIAWAILYASVALSAAFLIYGFNILHLTLRARRYSPPATPLLEGRPAVALHLPIYNELYVIGRLLQACVGVATQYGKDLVRIVVIDDSSDETSAEVDRLALLYSEQGFRIGVIRRPSRQGFKAGGLQAALETTDEKYVAVLDADFVPPPEFLDRTVPLLEHSPDVGFVQAKWGHIDRNHNLITKSLAIGVDGHFLLEQQARNGSGYLMNFNGSAGVLRAEAIRKAGGWAPDTLAEDLDLSYRMQLRGFRGVYLSDLEVPGELPPTITGLKRQQGRWARGSLQAAKKLTGQIRSSDQLSLGQKVEAGIHLTYYLVHPLMVASFILAVAAAFLGVNVISYAVKIPISIPSGGSGAGSLSQYSLLLAPWLVLASLVVLSTVAVLVFCIEAVRVQKLGLVGNIKQILVLMVIGYGVSISNSVQALGGLFSSQTGTFSRTPKYAINSPSQTWKGKRYQISFNRTMLLEAGAIVLAAAAMLNAWLTYNLGIMPILAVYLTSYSFVLLLSLAQSLRPSGALDS
jgi:cellulose synthase/poly-beta-1,6-N-acetylglucosamine synthase-like glycosyltransferase